MDLHGQIMNIQTPDDILSDVEEIIDRMGMLGLLQVMRSDISDSKESPAEPIQLDRMLVMAFKEGHKQARHAAADLSLSGNVLAKLEALQAQWEHDVIENDGHTAYVCALEGCVNDLKYIIGKLK